MVAVTLEPPADRLEVVEDLLSTAGLPTDDLRSTPATFYLAMADGEPVAVGGLERHGEVALLRSVAVAPEHRGEGIGTAVCDALAERARSEGVRRLYLLMTTAADFFRARGYERVEREAAPSTIRETAEFGSLCPDDATVMCRSL
jgi:amino-acid N-acetyltransferase